MAPENRGHFDAAADLQSSSMAYEISVVVIPVFDGNMHVTEAGCGNRMPPPSPDADQVIWFSAPGPIATDFA